MRSLIITIAMTLVGLTSVGEAATEDPIEYKLATVDAGGYISKDNITVARFRSLLQQLSSKFNEDRKMIADMTVKAQQLLRERGINEKMLDMMEGINKLFPQRFPNQRYQEYIGIYIISRNNGQSHNDAIVGLKQILEAFRIP